MPPSSTNTRSKPALRSTAAAPVALWPALHTSTTGRDFAATSSLCSGFTSASAISWAVFAPTAKIARGALGGTYAGVGGEATVGVGVGANALVGGNQKTISLQPLSVQAQQGLNVAVGIAAIELRPD